VFVVHVLRLPKDETLLLSWRLHVGRSQSPLAMDTLPDSVKHVLLLLVLVKGWCGIFFVYFDFFKKNEK
jgi:hypothetical protein